MKYDKLKQKYDLKKLRAASTERVKKSEKFNHLVKSIDWYKTQKEKTKRSLVAADFEKERKTIREMTDVFKKEEENKNRIVKYLSPNAKDKAQMEKFEDFSKTLRKDAVIEESMMIIADMLKTK